jgi:predicted metal-binding membrane protein
MSWLAQGFPSHSYRFPLRLTSRDARPGNHSKRFRIPFSGGLRYATEPMLETATQLTHLSPVARGVHRVFMRPRLLAVLCLAVLAGLGWLYLGLMVGNAARSGHALAPGMGFVDLISAGRLDAAGRVLFDALCRPTFGPGTHAGMPVPAAWTGRDAALVYLMWCAMAFAMMLPTAGAMILTYAELADTAAAKREAAVSPLMLAAGYAAVWLGFAAVATALQWGLTRLALLDSGLATASALFSGAIFIGAGAYQFSALKHACVTFCQRPFPFFFANWSTRPRAVFRLGVRQGLYCLGCCWALMLVMFAVGVMNVVWMAVLGVIMGLEKVMSTTRFSRVVGLVFIAIGAVFILSSIVAHWPARAG